MQGTGFRGRAFWRSIQQAGFFFVFLPLFPFVVKVVAETPLIEAGRETASADLFTMRAAPSGPAALAAADSATEFRIELLMGLDLFVRAERVLRAESSTFTNALGRVPDVLGALTHFYRIEIARATRNQLLVVATGEGRRALGGGNSQAVASGDRLTIDEEFRINANFPIPVPPRDYLHTLARTVMNRISANEDNVPEPAELERWEGVFHGYFQYEVRPMSSGEKTIVARGIHGPVQGDVVEMAPDADLYGWVYAYRSSVWAQQELYGHLENIYLAERIHQDHTGSYVPGLKALVPEWQTLAELIGDQSPVAVQDFQLDPNFGFHAEVSQRAPASSQGGSPSGETRAWSVNGYGQVSEVATIESLVDEFEQARKKIAGHGNVSSAVTEKALTDAAANKEAEPVSAEVLLRRMRGSQADKLAPVPEDISGKTVTEGGRKPLVIDALEGDK